MTWLDPQQTGLIIDYCFRMCSPAEAAEAERLVSRSGSAQELCERIDAALSLLSCVSTESCPDHLADITVQRLCQVAGQRIRRQQAEPRVIPADLRRPRLWRVAELAVAACLAVTAGAFFLTSLLSTPNQYPGQTSQENTVNPFEVPGQGGTDLRPIYIIDGNGNSVMPTGIRSPGGDDPYYPYPFPDFGPQIMPPFWQEIPDYRAPNRPVQPMPVSTPG